MTRFLILLIALASGVAHLRRRLAGELMPEECE